MPTESRPLDFRNAAAWRRWFESNHDRSDGEWVFLYKKGGSRAGLRHPEALDEALCFGWIDGQLRAVDGDRFRQRWTPRRKKSSWSEVNKRKVRELTRAGRMTEPGLAAVREAKLDVRWSGKRAESRQPAVVPELLAALKKDPGLGEFRGIRAVLPPAVRRLGGGGEDQGHPRQAHRGSGAAGRRQYQTGHRPDALGSKPVAPLGRAALRGKHVRTGRSPNRR